MIWHEMLLEVRWHCSLHTCAFCQKSVVQLYSIYLIGFSQKADGTQLTICVK